MTEATDLVDAFLSAATAAFPLMSKRLAERDVDDWMGGVALDGGLETLDLQEFKTCQSLVASYPGLADELAQPEEGQRFVYHESGARSLADPLRVTAHLLAHAAVAALWSTSGFTLEKYLSEVRLYATELTNWAADKSSKFTALQLVGLYNVFMIAGESIELPTGTLLAAPHHPAMRPVYDLGNAQISFGGGKWGDVPSTIFIQQQQCGVGLVEEPDKKVRAIFHEAADATLEPVALAITLAGGHHEHSAPAFGGSCPSHPISGGATSRSNARGYQKAPGIPLPTSLTGDVQDYFDRITKHKKDSAFLFAGRRLIASFNQHRPDDALVDAVVVWEALFSTTPETAFRVTAAVTRTLYPTFAAKDRTLVELQGFIQEIYGARSDVVHGNVASLANIKKKRKMTMYDCAVNAKRYSFRLMRAAFHWSDEVQKMDNGPRSKAAILDPDWP